MKNVRIFLAAFVLLALASAFVTPKSHITAPEKRFTDVDMELVWDGGNISGADFVLGTTSASELSVASNYGSALQNPGTNSCTSGTPRICKIRVTYSYTGTDPAPTPSEIATAVSNNYTANPTPPASYFPVVNGVFEFTYTDSDTGATITLQVITKANP